MYREHTALAPLVIPLAALAALLGACSSRSHAPPYRNTSALTAPSLGTANGFAVLAGTTVTNTGASTVVGDIGVDPGTAVTGFPPGIQTGGVMHKADAVSLQAQNDVTTAYDELAADACTLDLSGTDLGGLTLTQGVYCFSSSAQLTGKLTLDAAGASDAVFIFKTVSTLTTASSASVEVINGGSGCRVFWKVGSSATIGTSTTFVGSILALTSISLQTGASVDGRALARNGAVTMDDNHVAVSTCAPADAGVTDTGLVVDTGAGTDSGTTVDTTVGDAGGSDSSAADSAATDTIGSDCTNLQSNCF